MPIYEYQCVDCHHQFDVLQKITDPSPTECPACAKGPVTRLVSAAGFQLKGTGWYATDFKDKGKVEKTNNAATTTDPKAAKAPAAKSTDASVSTSGTKKGDNN